MAIENEQQGSIDLGELTQGTVNEIYTQLKDILTFCKEHNASKEQTETAVKQVLTAGIAQYGMILMDEVKKVFKVG